VHVAHEGDKALLVLTDHDLHSSLA
jgi:hypothetical protein